MGKNNAKNLFDVLLRVADTVGNIESAHLYSADFIRVDGKTSEGKPFSITFREENKND